MGRDRNSDYSVRLLPRISPVLSDMIGQESRPPLYCVLVVYGESYVPHYDARGRFLECKVPGSRLNRGSTLVSFEGSRYTTTGEMHVYVTGVGHNLKLPSSCNLSP